MSRDEDNLHDTAALRALAGGFDLQSSGSAVAELVDRTPRSVPKTPRIVDPADALGKVLRGQGAVRAEHPVSQNGPQNDPLAALGANVKPKPATLQAAARVNKARVDQMARQQAHHFSMQFRKTAIPFLFGMAVVLVLMGVVTIMVRNTQDIESIQDNPLMRQASLYSTIAFILAAVLVGGALLFQYELRRSQRDAQTPPSRRR